MFFLRACMKVTGALMIWMGGNLAAGDYSLEPTIDETSMVSTIVSDFPGEQLNMLNGHLEYLYRDVHIPGPNGMDVEVYRKYSQHYGNATAFRHMPIQWDIEIPKLFTYRASGIYRNTCFNADIVSLTMNGENFATSVGHYSDSYLPDDLPDHSIAFSNNAVLECREEPVLRLPDGKQVYFERKTWRYSQVDSLDIYFPTRVADRFGNEITYEYENHLTSLYGSLPLLDRITSPEGVEVNFEYVTLDGHPYVSEINYLDKTISYHYDDDLKLDYVADEEDRETHYNWVSKSVADHVTASLLDSIELPEGLEISYDYEDVNVDAVNDTPSMYYQMVKEKTISGDDIEDKTYTYHRSQSSSNIEVTVEESQGSVYLNEVDRTKIYRFQRVEESEANADSGKHATAGVLTSIALYEGEYRYGAEPEYEKALEWDYRVMGTDGCDRLSGNLEYLKCGQPLLETETETFRSGDVFTREYSAFTAYGDPQKTIENYVNATRYVFRTYYNDAENWLVNLPGSTWVAGSPWPATGTTSSAPSNLGDYYASYWDTTLSFRVEYTSASKPYKIYSAGGLLEKTYAYYSTGEIKRIDYNSQGGYELFSDYKAGVAQEVTVPRRYEIGTRTKWYEVDDEGRVTREKDYNGNIVDYTYDDIGRLKSINYADPRWNDVSLTYLDIPSKVTKISGADKTVTEYDVLRRVKLIKTVPEDAPTLYQNFHYDIFGNLTFKSFLSESSDETNGMAYEHDLLGRIKRQIIEETDTVRSWDYVAGNRIVYTDSRQNATTTQYFRVDEKMYGAVKHIQAPQENSTAITYDILMRPTRVTQSDERVQENAYDEYGRLRSITRCDTGVTSFGYPSGKRLIDWEARGEADVLDSDKVLYSYDNRGNLEEKRLFDGTVLLHQTLDPMGNIDIMASSGSSWSFDYNSRNLPERETLDIDGITMVLEWGYDARGNAASVTYPDGEVVAFAPNGYGQATRAGEYTLNAQYHPSGSLASFIYGNGLIRTVNANAMGMITSVQDTLVSLNYNYDVEHNLADMVDDVEPGYSLSSLAYDGLNRLTAGNAHGGAFSIDYNPHNDITGMTVDGQTLVYQYDDVTNLLTGVSGGVDRTFAYDKRGNVISNGIKTFTFNPANQMTGGGGLAFVYDGFGNRVRKASDSATEYFMYSRSGSLMYKAVGNSDEYTNYYYLGTQLVARKSDTYAVPEPDPEPEPEPVRTIAEVLISVDDLNAGNLSGMVQAAILDDGTVLWVNADIYTDTGLADQLYVGSSADELIASEAFYVSSGGTGGDVAPAASTLEWLPAVLLLL